jgi:flagellin
MGLTVGSTSIQLTLFNNNARINAALGRATERLATGLRINRGSDDPAGLIGAEHLRGDLVQFSAQTRANSALQSQIDIQQRGRQIASDVLIHVRGLVVDAADSSTSTEQRQAIQQEIDTSLDALDTLGSISGFAIPTELESLRLGGSANVVDGDTAEATTVLDEQLSTINQASAAAGAYQKYTLDVNQRLAEDQAIATAQALSLQADADYAEESSNLVKSQILTQASYNTIVLAQQLQREGVTSLFNALL